MEIGLAAWYWGRPDEAEAAFRGAEADGHGPFEATYRLVRLIQERDGTAAALAAARDALASRTAVLGPGHADTLRARCALLEQEAMALEEPDGRVPKRSRVAERFGALEADAERLFGAGSRVAAEIRQTVIHWTAAGGEPGKAVSLALGLVSDCQQVFGKDDDTTFTSRKILAESAWRAGRAAQALRLLQELIADAERRDGENGQFALDERRARARWLTLSKRHAEAIGEFQALVTQLTSCRGPLHANTLNCRCQLAEATGASGDPGTAMTMLRQLVPDVAKVSPEGKVPMLSYRRALASWTGEAGDPASAAAQFAELAAQSTLNRGQDDSYTRHLREHHARWQGQAPASPSTLLPALLNPGTGSRANMVTTGTRGPLGGRVAGHRARHARPEVSVSGA